jgi:hypothetical protein
MQEISEEEQKGIADADAVVEKTKMDNFDYAKLIEDAKMKSR